MSRNITPEDITGKVYGNLTALTGIPGKPKRVLAKCKCGHTAEYQKWYVKAQALKKDPACRKCFRPFNQLYGKRYGRLVVQDLVHGTQIGGKRYWMCLCDCGTSYDVIESSLLSRKTQSCGCLRVDGSRIRLTGQTYSLKHGMSTVPTKVHRIWRNLRHRCNSAGGEKHAKQYESYSKKGIKFCEEWDKSFEAFYRDVGDPPPGDHWKLRRIDCEGDFEPRNVRWMRGDWKRETPQMMDIAFVKLHDV